MRYYKDMGVGLIYAYDDEQVLQGLASNKIELTSTELELHLNPPKSEQQLRDEWKVSRAAAVDAIKVTTAAGNTFDGDEVSQGRMARAVIALSTVPGGTVTWILADNTIIEATAAELTEALALAGAAQAAVWVS